MISNEVPCCFNNEAESKKLEEAMESLDASFWRKAINDYMDSIMGDKT